MTCATDDTCGVALIDHHHRVVLLRKLIDLVKRADIAVHGEHAIGSYDAETLGLCGLELSFEIRHIAVGVTVTHGFAQTYAVDDRGVVECVGDDCVIGSEQRFEQSAVGIKARGVEDSVLGAKELGDSVLELLVGVLCTADEPHGSHAVAATIHAVFGSSDKFGVICESQIIVSAEVYYFGRFAVSGDLDA